MSWIDENPIAFSGLAKSRALLGKIAAEVTDTELTSEDTVILSLEIAKLLTVVTALSEALTDNTLDDEIAELLKGQ